MHHRTAPIGAGFALALLLTGCAPAATQPTSAPSAPDATGAPVSTTEPTASATDSASPAATAEPAADVFETQDGSMRVTLPEGWSVDDRSAMGEASEMYNRGAGWLNDVVLLDADGDQMLWYREHYGDDSVVCSDRSWPLEVPIDPWDDAPADVAAPVMIVGESGPASEFVGGAEPGAGGAQLGLVVEFATADCSGYDESIWTGSRVAQVDAVADASSGETPDTTIRFADEQAASAWLDGAEAATLVDVLSSMRFIDAPVLDAAP